VGPREARVQQQRQKRSKRGAKEVREGLGTSRTGGRGRWGSARRRRCKASDEGGSNPRTCFFAHAMANPNAASNAQRLDEKGEVLRAAKGRRRRGWREGESGRDPR
jgi:hypothetical protein